MRKFALVLFALAVMSIPSVGAERERQQIPPQDDLASPDYKGYRPSWANPYAEPPDVGVNDFPTPFDPADVDSGPSPLDPDAFGRKLRNL